MIKSFRYPPSLVMIISLFSCQPDSKNANTPALAISSSWWWCDWFQQASGLHTPPESFNHIIISQGKLISLALYARGKGKNYKKFPPNNIDTGHNFWWWLWLQPPNCDHFVDLQHETKSKPVRAYIQFSTHAWEISNNFFSTLTKIMKIYVPITHLLSQVLHLSCFTFRFFHT